MPKPAFSPYHTDQRGKDNHNANADGIQSTPRTPFTHSPTTPSILPTIPRLPTRHQVLTKLPLIIPLDSLTHSKIEHPVRLTDPGLEPLFLRQRAELGPQPDLLVLGARKEIDGICLTISVSILAFRVCFGFNRRTAFSSRELQASASAIRRCGATVDFDDFFKRVVAAGDLVREVDCPAVQQFALVFFGASERVVQREPETLFGDVVVEFVVLCVGESAGFQCLIKEINGDDFGRAGQCSDELARAKDTGSAEESAFAGSGRNDDAELT